MNRALPPFVLVAVILIAGCVGPRRQGPVQQPQQPESASPGVPQTLEERAGYAFGYYAGRQMQGQDVDVDQYIAGLRTALRQEQPLLGEETLRAAVQEYQQEMQRLRRARAEQEATDNLAASRAFLTSNAARAGVITTPSGLQYVVHQPGSGRTPTMQDSVSVTYRGTLIDGTVFDETSTPIQFRLGGVISGWQEGLQLMRSGARFTLYLPPELGYGPGGTRSIPPNSALIFEVQLLEIKGG